MFAAVTLDCNGIDSGPCKPALAARRSLPGRKLPYRPEADDINTSSATALGLQNGARQLGLIQMRLSRVGDSQHGRPHWALVILRKVLSCTKTGIVGPMASRRPHWFTADVDQVSGRLPRARRCGWLCPLVRRSCCAAALWLGLVVAADCSKQPLHLLGRCILQTPKPSPRLAPVIRTTCSENCI